MKKKNILISILACTSLLVACGEVEAKPNYVDDKLISFTGDEEVYKNDFTDLYDSLINAGTANSTIVDELLLKVAKKEIGVFQKEKGDNSNLKTIDEVGFLPKGDNATAEERFEKLIDDYMVDKVLGGQYSEDYLFQEENLAKELREALYDIKDNGGKGSAETDNNNFNKNVELVKNVTFDDIFSVKETDGSISLSGREKYADYREKVVKPIIYERLLTAKYLYNKKYKTIGRSAARYVRTIEIDNSSTEDKGSALRTLKNYVGGFLYASAGGENAGNYYPEVKNSDGNYDFNVETLANIWKGTVEDGSNAKNFIDKGNLSNEKLYNLYDEIEDDLNKIATKTGETYSIKSDLDYEDSTITNLVSEYTGSYSYSLDWGRTLKTRELNAKDITEDDFFVEKTGLTSLPSSIRSNLFSMTISRKVATIGGTTFLLPEEQENSKYTFNIGDNDIANLNDKSAALEAARNLIHYDSSSSTYYVIIVDDYSYSTSDLADGEATAENINAERREKAINTAILLGENSSYQESSLLYYFEEYGLTYHDQDFYDYITSTYEELFED